MNVEPTSGSSIVTGAIRQAARATGTDFKYLLATAQVESNLNPHAQVPTSSARGLFQFIEQTWLMTLKEQGPALGYGSYAQAISRTASGHYAVADPGMHDAVMNLRVDPTANALMAGAFTRANAGRLAEQLGRAPTEGELYIAHFLGAAGAGRLIGLASASPQAPAATLFPGPARANPAVFYSGRGHPRSVLQVYHALVGRYDTARAAPPSTPTMVAKAAGPPLSLAPPPIPRPRPEPEPQAVQAVAALASPPPTSESAPASRSRPEPPRPSPAQMVEAYALAAPPPPSAAVRESGTVFHDLFRTGATDEAVAPLVSALWAAPLPATGEPPQVKTVAAVPLKSRPKPVPLPEPPAAPPAAEASEPGFFEKLLPRARALFRGRV